MPNDPGSKPIEHKLFFYYYLKFFFNINYFKQCSLSEKIDIFCTSFTVPSLVSWETTAYTRGNASTIIHAIGVTQCRLAVLPHISFWTLANLVLITSATICAFFVTFKIWPLKITVIFTWKSDIFDNYFFFKLSALPRSLHSFRIFTLKGVPGKGRPFRLCMSKPIPNKAVPELCPEHGNNTLKTEKKIQK